MRLFKFLGALQIKTHFLFISLLLIIYFQFNWIKVVFNNYNISETIISLFLVVTASLLPIVNNHWLELFVLQFLIFILHYLDMPPKLNDWILPI